MASSTSTTFSTDPALWIVTSLTAGSAHIVTATSRLETILRANKVPFKAVDIATDDRARMLWGRRAGKDASGRMRKLPGLVQEGVVLGDLVEIEEWNEYGELKQNVKIYYDDYTIPTISEKPKEAPLKPKPAPSLAASAAAAAAPSAPPLPPASAPKPKQEAKPAVAAVPQNPPGPSIADEAAKKAKEMRLQSLREKVYGKEGAKAKAEEEAKAKAEEDAKGSVTVADAKADKADAEKPKETEAEAETKDKPDGEEEGAAPEKTEAEDKETPSPLKPSPSGSSEAKEGLQSPTSAAWKPAATDSVQPLQSPTSSSWHASLPERKASSFRGSVVESPSEEEIEAVEKEEEIIEEPEEEEEEGKEQDEAERRKSVSQS